MSLSSSKAFKPKTTIWIVTVKLKLCVKLLVNVTIVLNAHVTSSFKFKVITISYLLLLNSVELTFCLFLIYLLYTLSCVTGCATILSKVKMKNRLLTPKHNVAVTNQRQVWCVTTSYDHKDSKANFIFYYKLIQRLVWTIRVIE